METPYNTLHFTSTSSTTTTSTAAASCAFPPACKHIVYTYILLMPRSHLECVYSSLLFFPSPPLLPHLLPLSFLPPLCSGPLLSPLCAPLLSALSSPFPLLSSHIISSLLFAFPTKKKNKLKQYNYMYKSSVSCPSCQMGPRLQAFLSSSLS